MKDRDQRDNSAIGIERIERINYLRAVCLVRAIVDDLRRCVDGFVDESG
jgi:hypothetical protein